ncbi:hypothetical protein LOK49_LG08G02822 [Camellia lanceoleosa]|uniref:Uncharacterized protein n=1 Tax=Camellia lanceoleosa TaxID=1840588 RepID=A0ACC0GP76_9ERIC|nr:hypothetical protein LOK49_LG08G02822 [Camellia lanceoleosa]
MLLIQLMKFVKSKKLVKIKNSYKVTASEKVKLVAISIKESEKMKTEKAVVKKKGEKTKRLSQVKPLEALNKKKKKVSTLRRGTHPSRSWPSMMIMMFNAKSKGLSHRHS